MPKPRDPAWLLEVQAPGPNGRMFTAPEAAPAITPEFRSGSLMEDDVDVSQFTPGAAAYAGYENGSYANMTAVRAYAASQNARSLSVTPDGDPAADVLDMEPGDASPSQFPAFWRAKGGKDVYAYGSASWVQQIIDAASAAGIHRNQYKVWSAHYVGQHICGPTSCGYSWQADGTQFSMTYQGRSLDGTVFSVSFFGTPPPPPPPSNPWPLHLGSAGEAVVTLQKNLNRWRFASPALTADGSFGALTKAAVQKALQHWHYSAVKVTAAVVDEALWNHLQGAVPKPPPPPPANWTYPAPTGLTAHPGTTTVDLTWHAVPPQYGKVPSGYEVVLYNDPPILDKEGHWTIVRDDKPVIGTRADITNLEPDKGYQAHIWALGSPVSSDGHYAAVRFTTT